MNLVRATVRVSGLTAAGYAVALAVQVVFARRFGAAGVTDAWFSAAVVPNFLAIVLFASLAKACVPVFVDRLGRGESAAWRTACGALNTTLVALLLGAAATTALARPIGRVLFPDLPPSSFELARLLLAVSIWAVPAVGASLVLTAWLQARRRFGRAAVAGLFPPAGTLLGLLLLPDRLPAGKEVACMAIGLAAGAWMQLGFLSFAIFRSNQATLGRSDPAVRRIFGKTGPLFVAAGLIALYPVIEKRFASGLSEGAIAWLGFGRRPLNLLLILLAVPAATTSYTAFSETAARGDLPSLRQKAWRTAAVCLLLLTPAALFFGVHAEEILRLIYERGRFAATDTAAAAAALRLLLPVTVFGTVGTILVHAFLARGKVGAPLLTALVGIVIYTALGAPVAGRWGFKGLALLQSGALGVTLLLILGLLLRDLGPPRGERVPRTLLDLGIAGGACFAVLFFSRDLLSIPGSGLLTRIVLLAALAAAAAAVYLGALSLLRNRHLAEVLRGLRRGGSGDRGR
jgi:putative peptidoglycan lipid II flippase